MADVVMRIILSAQSGNTGRIIGDVVRSLGGAGLTGVLAGVGIAVGAVAVGLGILSVKMAGDFQQGLNRLVTGAGDVTDNMQKMGQAILGVSVATGVMTGPLLQAMYLIISSGQRGAQAMDTLSVAARGAQIEQANVVDVANVLSGVMTNYGTKVFNATQYMNGLIEAVKNGKITLQQLAVAMGPIDPIAQHLGISMADVAAAMTTQTNAMIPAARAATGLRFMMSALERPTHKATAEMAALGLDSIKVAEEMKISLPGALQMIVNAAKKVGPEGSVPFNRAVGDMVGGIRGLSAFMGLTGPHMADFVKNSAAITAAMKGGKTEVSGWSLAQSGFNIQMDRAKAAAAALLIVIGTNLLPVLTRIVQAVVPIIVAFTNWISSGKAASDVMSIFHAVVSRVMAVIAAITPFFQIVWGILQGIGTFLAGIFVPVWQTLVQVWQTQILPSLQALWKAIQPLMPLFEGIAALIGGVLLIALGLLIGALDGIITAAGAVLSGIARAFGGIVEIISGVFQVIAGIIKFFVDLFTGNFKALGGDLGGIMQGIGTMFKGAWDTISSIFSGAFNGITGLVGGFFSGMGNFFHGLTGLGTSESQKLANNVKQNVSTMASGVQNTTSIMAGFMVSQFGTMQQQSVSQASTLTDKASQLIAQLHDNVIGDFSKMDTSAIGYWNDIASYVENNPVVGSVSYRSGGSATAGHFASGTSYAPGGMAVVGERGPEIMYVPRGAQIVPHDQIGGGGGGPAINIYISTMAGSRAEVERMADLIEQEMARRFRGQTPGYSAGGVW